MVQKQREKRKIVKKGKWWFRLLKRMMKIRYKPPVFCYLGKPFEDGSIIISNHEGTDAPMALEMYLDRKLRMWGAGEMNSGVIALYRYQTKVYYCEKKHWHPVGAYTFCLIASPLTNLFYKGLNLISTWRDVRFCKTLRESMAAIKRGESVVIFPEDSSKGYLSELEGFYHGFLSLAKHLLKKGVDVPIVVSYFQKEQNRYLFDEGVLYSELIARYGDHDTIAAHLLERCNELGRMPRSKAS
ncbi:MAG: hypothetical protein IKC63_07405 [Clostridia bacterium]|nr:hypothetical protein [Clostridia bacterium]